jgi:hypothetical protein
MHSRCSLVAGFVGKVSTGEQIDNAGKRQRHINCISPKNRTKASTQVIEDDEDSILFEFSFILRHTDHNPFL